MHDLICIRHEARFRLLGEIYTCFSNHRITAFWLYIHSNCTLDKSFLQKKSALIIMTRGKKINTI